MIVDFGKYRGQDTADLPRDYAWWLLSASRRLVKALENDLGAAAPVPPSRGDLPPLTADLIEAGCRSLAQKWHPDAGGRLEDMVALNQAMEKLRAIAGTRKRQ